MDVLYHVDYENRVDHKLKKVVSCVKLISIKSLEGSGKVLNYVPRFLQSTRNGNDYCCQYLFLLRSCKEIVDQAMKERPSHSSIAHESIFPIGKFSLEKSHSILLDCALDAIHNQIKLAELHQIFLRPIDLECPLSECRRNNQRACSVHTSFGRRV